MDLVRGNDGWKDWNFKELLKELKRWTDINPVEETAAERGPSKRNQNWAHKQISCPSFYNAQSRPPQEPQTGNQCVYCDGNHKSERLHNHNRWHRVNMDWTVGPFLDYFFGLFFSLLLLLSNIILREGWVCCFV